MDLEPGKIEFVVPPPSFKITIETIIPLGKDSNGYEREETRDVYIQRVRDLNLWEVIKAVNNRAGV